MQSQIFRSKCAERVVSAGIALTMGLVGTTQMAFAAEPGVTSSEVVIGASTGLTGPVQELAEGVTEGVNLYFDRVNKSGGISGRKLKYHVIDDNYQPEKTVANIQKMNEGAEAVFAVMGDTCTACSKAALPYILDKKVPLLFPFSGGDPLRTPFLPVVFNLRSSYQQEADMAVRYAVTELGLKKVAVMVQDDAFGASGRSGVARTLADLGLKIAADATYARQTGDVAPAVEILSKANPEVVYIQANPNEAIQFIQKCRAKGFSPVFLGPSILNTNLLLSALGEDANRIYITEVLPLPSDTSYALVQEFQADLKKAGKTKPSSFMLEGYADAKLLVEILKKMGPELTRAKLVSTIEGLKNIDLGGLQVSFSSTEHQGLKTPFLIGLKDGKATQLK